MFWGKLKDQELLFLVLWKRNSVLIQCTTFKAGDDRISTLTEKQKEQFEAYMSAQREVIDLAAKYPQSIVYI